MRRGQFGLSLFHLVHVPFVPIDGERFLVDLQGHNTLAFRREATGAIAGFTFHRAEVNNLEFQRVR